MFSLTKAYEQMSFEEQKSFYRSYYSSPTNDRGYTLESMLSILLLMQFFHYASVPNFIVLLTFSPKIRGFCRLPEEDIPDESCISKFKTALELFGMKHRRLTPN